MTMAQTGTTRAAIWARVSTAEQKTANQLDQLRQWAAARGVEVVAEFITEDSAWDRGNGPKGREFDQAREDLLAGARRGQYAVVLTWALDRLSRRGIEDTLGFVRQLGDSGCAVWSHQESWVESTADPMLRQLIMSIAAWMAEMESRRRSERTRAGMARARAEGKRVGGRKTGSKDKRKRSTEGYSAAWTPERRAELAERNRNRTRAQDRETGDT